MGSNRSQEEQLLQEDTLNTLKRGADNQHQRPITTTTNTTTNNTTTITTQHDLNRTVDQDERAPLLGTSEQRTSDGIEPDPEYVDEYTRWEGIPWYRRPSVYWLLIPWIFSTLAFGGSIIPKLNLILSLVCRQYYAEQGQGEFTPSSPLGEIDPQCRSPEVSARVATFQIYCSTISGVLSAIIAPKLGSLSDRYGRKKIMIITNFGTLCGEIISVFAARSPDTFPLNLILVGFFLDGLCGSFLANMAVGNCYASDVTPPHKRKVIFGYFQACLFFGIAVGPFLASWIMKLADGLVVVFYVVLGFHVCFIFLLIFVIPESLTKSRMLYARQKYNESHQVEHTPNTDIPSSFIKSFIKSQFRNFKKLNILEPLEIIFPSAAERSKAPDLAKNLILLAVIDSVLFGVAIGAITSIVLYSVSHFQFDVEAQSYFIAIVNISRAICIIIVLPLLSRIFRAKLAPGVLKPRTGADRFELNIIRLGIVFDVLGFILYSLASSGFSFIFAGTVASLGAIGSPTLQATLTKHVRPERIGQLLGAVGLLHSIGRVLGPIFFNSLYALTAKSFDRAIFIVLAALFGLALVLSLFVKPGIRMEEVEAEYIRRESLANRIATEQEDEAIVAI